METHPGGGSRNNRTVVITVVSALVVVGIIVGVIVGLTKGPNSTERILHQEALMRQEIREAEIGGRPISAARVVGGTLIFGTVLGAGGYALLNRQQNGRKAGRDGSGIEEMTATLASSGTYGSRGNAFSSECKSMENWRNDNHNREFPPNAGGIVAADFNPQKEWIRLETHAHSNGDHTTTALLQALAAIRNDIAPKILRIASVRKTIEQRTCLQLYEPAAAGSSSDDTLIGYVPLIVVDSKIDALLSSPDNNPIMYENFAGYRTARLAHELIHCLADLKRYQRTTAKKQSSPIPFTFAQHKTGYCPRNAAAVNDAGKDIQLLQRTMQQNIKELQTYIFKDWYKAGMDTKGLLGIRSKPASLPYHLNYMVQKIQGLSAKGSQIHPIEYDATIFHVFILCFQTTLCHKKHPAFYRALSYLTEESFARINGRRSEPTFVFSSRAVERWILQGSKSGERPDLP